ncbi:geranylgeranyl reductase family protein [Brevirhabdus sp.]|uniref:geranylgeranyl reductase family protein n=1 Tax=Brevirhabdus sp. TaxID=2004514 RepID=UPI0040594902
MRTFDVVVIGAGPCGTSAAVTAADAGLSTLLVDRSAFPRDKLCGGLFTGRSVRLLRDIHRLTPDDPALFRPCRAMRFVAGTRELARMDDAPVMYLTMRRALDAHLLAHARLRGVTLITGQGLQQVHPDRKQVDLKGGDRIGYRVLIGADGVNSAVAKTLFARAFDPATIGFGLEVEVPPAEQATPPGPETVEVDFDAAAWGYGWAFPKAHGTTIGVGGIQSQNPNPKADLAAYLARHGIDDPGARIKGQFLPFGAYRRKPGRAGVLLAGDAAGLVDPITGEGIALAMDSGRLAARAAQAAIAEARPERAFAIYRRALRPIHASLSEARLWRHLIFSPTMKPAFKASFARSQTLPRRYLDLLAGDLEYRDLRGDLLRRAPRAMVRALFARRRAHGADGAAEPRV